MDQYDLRSSCDIQHSNSDFPADPEPSTRSHQNKQQSKSQNVRIVEEKLTANEEVGQNNIDDGITHNQGITEDKKAKVDMQVDGQEQSSQPPPEQTQPTEGNHASERGRSKMKNTSVQGQQQTSADAPGMMYVITDRNIDIGDGKVAAMEPLLDEHGREIDVSQVPRHCAQRHQPMSQSELLELAKDAAYGSDFSL